MTFEDVFSSQKYRYTLGIESQTGQHYISIPVSNSLVDYDEYYAIDPVLFNRLQQQPEAAIEFAEKCRNRELDELLMIKPGRDRGTG